MAWNLILLEQVYEGKSLNSSHDEVDMETSAIR